MTKLVSRKKRQKFRSVEDRVNYLIGRGMRKREIARLFERERVTILRCPERRRAQNGRWEYRCENCRRWLPWGKFEVHGQSRKEYINKICIKCSDWLQRQKKVQEARAVAASVYRRTVQSRAAISEEIARIYKSAKTLGERTGMPHHVDHIIPIKHELICGLHVAVNLQVLPYRENLKKKNSFVPYYETADGHVTPIAGQCKFAIRGTKKRPEKPKRDIRVIRAGQEIARIEIP